jgi:putative glycosyltransferase
VKLSIVTTLYQSAPFVEEFYERAVAAAQRAAQDEFEILFVNDGSPDESLAKAVAIAEGDSRCVVVDLSRNFGHYRAIMTGLAHATGELIYLIDSDLEEQPESLEPFLALLRAEQVAVVYGVQIRRKGGAAERWSGALFYRLMRIFSATEMAPNMVTARLMTRRYVAALLLHKERESDIGGLWSMAGFAQRPSLVEKLSKGRTTYDLRRKLKLATNSVVSFSSLPLRLILYFGLATTTVALAWLLALAFTGSSTSGASTLLASLWFVGGAIMTALGIIGLYLANMLAELKRRPYTIVRKVYGRNERR